MERFDIFGPSARSKYVAVPGDGNGLFSSISLAVFGSIGFHSIVRSDACAYAEGNWEFYHLYAHVDADKDAYLSEMRRNMVWGTSLEISALSALYKRRIIVVQDGINISDMGLSNDPQPIYLRFSNGNHYDLYLERPFNVSLSRDDDIVPLQGRRMTYAQSLKSQPKPAAQSVVPAADSPIPAKRPFKPHWPELPPVRCQTPQPPTPANQVRPRVKAWLRHINNASTSTA
ncbi:Hypothetical predicted protein [Olea europaea subsp. europaea]|uniref:OTU domain-containing protein n=1 Tax=Olea europaea subsp. europaea TaxID=158383 RepID=A0A8S0SDB1_OLEEU|nr:Hypothetical predicted protein [Olea europaea subsp. europaea]